MAVKTKAIQVVKHQEIIVSQLGTRSKRDLRQDFEDLATKGYKVYGITKASGLVKVQFGLSEPWTVEDLMTEVDELLAAR